MNIDWDWWKDYVYWERKRVWFPKRSSVNKIKIPAFSYCWVSTYDEYTCRASEFPATHRCYLTDEEFTFHVMKGDIKFNKGI